jgi:hypothetical protein
MSKFQIARYTSKTTATVAPEYGTFDSVDEAVAYITGELLADYADVMAGKSNYYVTAAEESLTRTQLTDFETAKLHAVAQEVRRHSFEVGCFVTRSGQQDAMTVAAELYLSLNDDLVSDEDVRTGALEYGLAYAENRAKDRHASQAATLQGQFLVMLYKNAIADRADAKVGA